MAENLNVGVRPWIQSLILSMLVLLLFYPLENEISTYGSLEYASFRVFRMFCCYLVPFFWFINSTNLSLKDMGLKYDSWGLWLGILAYAVPTFVFIANEIFSKEWQNHSSWEIVLLLTLTFVMASITDLWFHGFIFMGLVNTRSVKIAFLVQNTLWFVFHYYEIILLEPYIGWLNAFVLSLYLGLVGDIITLKTKSVIGLMIGHSLFNLAFVLFAIF
ncbi:MAG: CPBP family intramembrane metalloprotease [Candidatus Heimdallarchaeota archaeon]|nr:CPBP family intramembrane metalloprotease [Candidatus Heimdallarchaeota archaeon]MCK5048301.1 CPBP family intramembrane metalloprotease [Candidatus Heimdallarchaeota archaeon]